MTTIPVYPLERMVLSKSDDIHSRLFSYKPGRGDTTRLKIVEAAISCMANEGLEDITFDLLGEKVGIGKANVRYHFANKKDVFLAAIKLIVMTAQDITIALVKKASTPHAQIGAVIDGAFAWLQAFPAHGKVWLLFMHLATRNSEYLKLHHEARHAGASRLAALLRNLNPELSEKAALGLGRDIQKIITSEILELITCRFPEKLGDHHRLASERSKALLKANGILWKTNR